jgi:hypothetical protein
MTPNQLASELSFRYRHPVRWYCWHLLRGIVIGSVVFAWLYMVLLELAWAARKAWGSE